MTRRRELLWWLYITVAVVLLFAVPDLMSARDTIAVVLGAVLMTAFAVVSWKFWMRRLIKLTWEKLL